MAKKVSKLGKRKAETLKPRQKPRKKIRKVLAGPTQPKRHKERTDERSAVTKTRKRIKATPKEDPKTSNRQKPASAEEIMNYIYQIKKGTSMEGNVRRLVNSISRSNGNTATLGDLADHLLSEEGKQLRFEGRYGILILGFLIENGTVDEGELSPFERAYLGLPA